MSLRDITDIVLAIMTSVATVTSVVALRRTSKTEKPHFDFYRLHRQNKPTEIVISNPTQAIDRCAIYIDGVPIPCGEGIETDPRSWSYVHIGGSAIFLIPQQLEKDSAMVVVKDGREILKKTTLKNIPVKGD